MFYSTRHPHRKRRGKQSSMAPKVTASRVATGFVRFHLICCCFWTNLPAWETSGQRSRLLSMIDEPSFASVFGFDSSCNRSHSPFCGLLCGYIKTNMSQEYHHRLQPTQRVCTRFIWSTPRKSGVLGSACIYVCIKHFAYKSAAFATVVVTL